MSQRTALPCAVTRLIDTPERRKAIKEDIIMKVLIALPITLAAVALAWSPTTGSHAKKSQLDGTWELLSGQLLPKRARDIKVILGGHFIFAAYDSENGRPLYTAGGT